jgi:hypothetical protein
LSHEAVFRASVMGLFAPPDPSGGELPALATAGTAAAAAAAAALGSEADARGEEMRGVTFEDFGDRLKRIVAFASLELEHCSPATSTDSRAAGGGGGGARDALVDDAEDAAVDARLAALAREWLLLYAASSKHTPVFIELAEVYDLQRRRLVGGAGAGAGIGGGGPPGELGDDADAAFALRSTRALEAARLSPSQQQSVADAFAFFQADTRAPLRDWRRAADELAAAAVANAGGALAGGPAAAAAAAAATAATAASASASASATGGSLDRLSDAIARCLVTRSAFYLSVISVITPRQLLRAMCAVYPRVFRPMQLGWASLQAERRTEGLAGAAPASGST